MTSHAFTTRLYGIVTGEKGAPNCNSLSDDACTHVPQNFLLNAASGNPVRLAQRIAGPDLVLPWLLGFLGAPAFFVGLLLPAHRFGVLIPQFFVVGQINRFKQRKWLWVGMALIRVLVILLMIPSALFLPPVGVGIAIIVLLTIWGMAGGTGSIAFVDLIAKTIPKGQRGALMALRELSGGILTLGVGLLLSHYANTTSITPFIWLLASAAGMWFIAALLIAAVDEEDSEPRPTRGALAEVSDGIKYLRANPGIQHFLVARGLILSVQILVPFFALNASTKVGADASSLGLVVITVGFAEALSSMIWGRLSRRMSRQVMTIANLLAVSAGILVLLFNQLSAQPYTLYLYVLPFLIIGFARSGAMIGRLAYFLDAAPEEERPRYTALNNIIMGGVTMGSAIFGVIAAQFGVEAVILILMIAAGIGSLVTWRLPPVDKLITQQMPVADPVMREITINPSVHPTYVPSPRSRIDE